MANLNPIQTTEFLAHKKTRLGDRALAPPIPVRFPVEMDQQLRAMDDRQSFIRSAVAEKLAPPACQCTDLECLINRTLMTIPPRDRAASARLFKKLLAQAND
jgi:hypothetical protein